MTVCAPPFWCTQITVFVTPRNRKTTTMMVKGVYNYSQTSVLEHNPFQKAVRKVICSKSETSFPIKINANNFNPFQL